MYLLGRIFKLIKLLNSEKGAVSIASGFSMGMVLGFIPSNVILVAGILFFFCIFRINGAALFLAWAVFGVLAFLLDPLFDIFGYWLLTEVKFLEPAWMYLMNLPVVPWTRLNNSIVMGSLVTGILLFVPAIFVFKFLIVKYRESVVRRISKSKWFKAWKATTLYKLYSRYTSLKESWS